MMKKNRSKEKRGRSIDGGNTNFAILGLGRFGMSIVRTLSEFDVDILVCDNNENKIQHMLEFATHAVQVDVSDEDALVRLGLGNFDVVVIGTGEDFEASQMAAMVAKEQGAKYIVVKAQSFRQKKILQSLGADEVILVESEMGAKMARKLVGHNFMDLLDESALSFIKEMKPYPEWVGKTIIEADIRNKHNINILGVMHKGKLDVSIAGDFVIGANHVFVVLVDESYS